MNRIPSLNMNFIYQKIKEIYRLIESPGFNSIYKNPDYSLNNYEGSRLLRIEQKSYLQNVWIALNALSLNYCQSSEEKNIRLSEILEKIYECQYIDPEII